jgi:hypothetical protein
MKHLELSTEKVENKGLSWRLFAGAWKKGVMREMMKELQKKEILVLRCLQFLAQGLSQGLEACHHLCLQNGVH